MSKKLFSMKPQLKAFARVNQIYREITNWLHFLQSQPNKKEQRTRIYYLSKQQNSTALSSRLNYLPQEATGPFIHQDTLWSCNSMLGAVCSLEGIPHS